MATQSHESLTSFRKVSVSSSRKFGVTMGLVLAFLGAWPAIRHHQPMRLWVLAAGGLLGLLGLLVPKILDPLNKLWFQFGLLLARITNPIVMGVMFFAAVVPLGWLIRKRGHDLLRLRRSDKIESYWIERDAAAPPSSLIKQF